MIDLKVGYSCNNNCIFCAIKDHEQKDRTFEECDKIITRERENHNSITITGGEPTIRNDIWLLLERARELGYNINIQSNGRLFSSNSIYYINNYNIQNLLISMHGSNAEIHDSLTGIQGSFDETECGIENLINCGHNVSTNTVLMKSNIFDLKNLCILLVSLGVKNVLLSYPDLTGGALKNIELIPTLSEIKLYLPEIINTCKKLDINVKFDNIPRCILCEYSEYDNYKEPVDLILLNNKIKDFIPNTIVDKCKNCNVVSVCCHPQIDYIKKFGDMELEASK